MFVVKRNEKREPVKFDKITKRILNLCKESTEKNLNALKYVDPIEIAQKVVSGIKKGITTTELDNLAAETAMYKTSAHPEYGTLASRIAISSHHKNTDASFFRTMKKIREHNGYLAKDVFCIIRNNKKFFEELIDYNRDFNYDYFGFRTLMRLYLIDINGKIVERPQHMIMRVIIGIHKKDLDAIKESYELMSHLFFTHASPTLFNAGTSRPQLSSCFLMGLEDSIEGIYREGLADVAQISKWGGGLGIHIQDIRAKGSVIKGTNGRSDGIIPMLRVFNETARYVNQSGRRKGSFAIYIEPWHADIMEFLDLRKNHGKEEMRARDLFYAMWICDLFMERVKNDEMWTLVCPSECPGLTDNHSDKFNELYLNYEKEIIATYKEAIYQDRSLLRDIIKDDNNKDIRDIFEKTTGQKIDIYYNQLEDAIHDPKSDKVAVLEKIWKDFVDNILYNILEKRGEFERALYTKYRDGRRLGRRIKARKIWEKILDSQAETGTPYMLYKDACNKKSNQQNLGTIKSSNLCVEIIQYSDHKETAVCNLASVALPKCIKDGVFDFKKLEVIVKVMVKNLNKVINVNYYPLKKAELSNKRHRPIGIGIQGLADSFIIMRYPFESKKALKLNKDIFETIYFSALTASMEVAKIEGPYETFRKGYNGEPSPACQGKLQFDLWGVKPSNRYNWKQLKTDIKEFGLRNSLLVAPMPTASTAQSLGNSECFDPITSNVYTRRTLAGEFPVVNKYLVEDLNKLGMWNKKTKNRLMHDEGSVQNLKIPQELKDLYKTAWEISPKALIDLAVARGPFICQSQSMNLYMATPDRSKMTSMHFYAWKKGLKSGMYYLRSKAATTANKVTVDKEMIAEEEAEENAEENSEEAMICRMEDGCISCGG
jgi:ribonucleotide reductase alpha subunit